jgi:putative endonuclease
MTYFVYLLECSDRSFYCGYTSDLNKRIETHQKGKGGKYTRTHLPVKLIYSEEFKTRSEAMKREVEIKKFSRKQKEALVFEK